MSQETKPESEIKSQVESQPEPAIQPDVEPSIEVDAEPAIDPNPELDTPVELEESPSNDFFSEEPSISASYSPSPQTSKPQSASGTLSSLFVVAAGFLGFHYSGALGLQSSIALFQNFSALLLIFVSLVLGLLLLSIPVLITFKKSLEFRFTDWGLIGLAGVFGMALPTIARPQSEADGFIESSLTVLLVSLLAPIVATITVVRPTRIFFISWIIALPAAFLLWNPQFEWTQITAFRVTPQFHLFGVITCLWVLHIGILKHLLKRHSAPRVLFWCFWFGALFIAGAQGHQLWQELRALPYGWDIQVRQNWTVLIAAFVVGPIAHLLFYRGLQSAPVSLSLLAILLTPISFVLGKGIETGEWNWIAVSSGVVLILAIATTIWKGYRTKAESFF